MATYMIHKAKIIEPMFSPSILTDYIILSILNNVQDHNSFIICITKLYKLILSSITKKLINVKDNIAVLHNINLYTLYNKCSKFKSTQSFYEMYFYTKNIKDRILNFNSLYFIKYNVTQKNSNESYYKSTYKSHNFFNATYTTSFIHQHKLYTKYSITNQHNKSTKSFSNKILAKNILNNQENSYE
ncbi:hypothetical protein C1I72_04750 [Ehrlichia canis]|uniref:Uncharacterized protein n=2 Tax=Ehrlichia canis TaxID=944 RepID=A0ACA6B027_EHRCJ|nr:unknown function U3 [Ehrlichia canis]AAZ68934.1 hypothetical protein Ecaj_0903 [Ehrlichia canis str. Jake]AUO55137.1 hypothetical protein C1I72_04750 [Ehrlichia canis]